MSPDQPIILGGGATQKVDAELVKDLKEKWVKEGKLAANADETAVLRDFVENVIQGDVAVPTTLDYVVQPGDSWAGIAGRFLGDQSRFPEIIAFNQLPPRAGLLVGQRIRIPSK